MKRVAGARHLKSSEALAPSVDRLLADVVPLGKCRHRPDWQVGAGGCFSSLGVDVLLSPVALWISSSSVAPKYNIGPPFGGRISEGCGKCRRAGQSTAAAEAADQNSEDPNHEDQSSQMARSAALLAAVMVASTPAAAQQQQKPNILFIMGDDIGWMQPSIYHRGLMVGETPNIDRIGQRRRDLHGLRRHAELHLRAQCLLHRHVSAAHRHDPAATAGQPVLPAARHPGDRQVPARSRLQHRRVRQEPPGRPHRVPADGARLPGILGLPLSPRRDAAGELPRHQLDADRAGRRAAVPQHAGPRPPGGPRRRGPKNDALPDAPAPGHLVQVLRRHGEEPDAAATRAR